jgi:hypothetical protein
VVGYSRRLPVFCLRRAGFILEPVIGGVLYDGWGFEVSFIASAAMAAIAFIVATVLV